MLDELNHKVDQAKRATGTYLRDQVEQTRTQAVSYVVAAGLFAAAAVFLIAAVLVGITAGFRWIEIHYGLFEAFGALAALLSTLVVLLIVLAIYRLKRPPKRIVPLSSRLRVAISASPSTDEVAPAATLASLSLRGSQRGRNAIPLVVASSLIGWALMRRRN
jgi:MFS family permease